MTVSTPSKKRAFVCGTPNCGEVVHFSSAQNQTRYHRAECEFAGSFACHAWEDLPACLRKEAWEERFIDATWHCTHMCGAKMTINEEQNKSRQDRILRWQHARAEAGKGSAPASSSTASGASPPGGKGAKAGKGKVKRAWEVMQGDKSKGSKKGGSADQRQPPWRRR